MVDSIIRPARRQDAGFLLPLVNRASEGIAAHVWAQVAEPGQDPMDLGLSRIESEDAGISYNNAWIAEVADRPGGCLIAFRKPDAPEHVDPDVPPMFRPLLELENAAAGTGYVYVLSTLAEMRGQGIGSQFLTFAERYRGPLGMSLIVANNNVGARRLYERCGYRAVSSRPMIKNGWQSTGTDWVLMIKP
jgi:GNAT superfamily N-acetyltransferase